MVSVCASVNLRLHHKVQKFSSGTGSPGWHLKNGHKNVVVWWWFAHETVIMATFPVDLGLRLVLQEPLKKPLETAGVL